MKSILPFPDSDFKNSFQALSLTKEFSPCVAQIIEAAKEGVINKGIIEKILSDHKKKSITDIKDETLNLLLKYIDYILEDSIITHKELANFKVLKMLFKIKEGDFFDLKHNEIQRILNTQFAKIYQDNIIDKSEAILKVGLQELFDLGYDQFLDLTEGEVRKALNRGANLNDLDTVIQIKKF